MHEPPLLSGTPVVRALEILPPKSQLFLLQVLPRALYSTLSEGLCSPFPSTKPGVKACGDRLVSQGERRESRSVFSLRSLSLIPYTDHLPRHRLNTILNSDRVLVLQAGRVVELDSPATLHNQPHSLFQQLLQSSQQGVPTSLGGR